MNHPWLRRSLAATLLASMALVLAAPPVCAQTVDEAKRHFTNGVHLFEDRNFAGALVEFEASYKKNPTAVALQNIAVCQKGLFRYADAIATLERMLREFAGQLSQDDKKAAEDAIREMSALLGTVVVRVTPPDARVSIDGAPLSAEALKNPVRLAAGEHRIVAEAPGRGRQEQTITVVSGQKDQAVVLTLTPLSGTLVVRAHDAEAAIAIDGVHVGYERWQGPVSAGAHEVHVYTGSMRRKSHVVAQPGQTTELDSKLSPVDAITDAERADTRGPPPYVAPPQRGLFGYLAFGGDTMGNQAPPGLKNAADRATGGFLSLRVGYRFSTNWAAEFMAESGVHSIGACPASGGGSCTSVVGKYQFSSTRIGPAVRLMTNGRKARAIGTLGLGAVVHQIKYDEALKSGTGLSEQTAAGSFVQLSGGFELNLGHFLLGAAIVVTGENADEKRVGTKNTGAAGLEVRAGYGQW